MQFLLDSLQSLWRSLLFHLGLQGKQGSLLLLGLDNAGKTTLLHRLQNQEMGRPFPPTDRPTLHEEFTVYTGGDGHGSRYNSRLTFGAWDLGGHEAVRHLWHDYVSNSVSAILFVVDAADCERWEEAAYELDALIGEGLLYDIPVALLLNKCDLTSAASTADILSVLEWDRLRLEHAKPPAGGGFDLVHEQPHHEANGGSTNGVSSYHTTSPPPIEQMAVFRISVLKGEGYQEAFRWIAGFL